MMMNSDKLILSYSKHTDWIQFKECGMDFFVEMPNNNPLVASRPGVTSMWGHNRVRTKLRSYLVR